MASAAGSKGGIEMKEDEHRDAETMGKIQKKSRQV